MFDSDDWSRFQYYNISRQTLYLQAVVYNAHLSVVTSSIEQDSPAAGSNGKGKGKAREEAAEAPAPQDEKPIDYFTIGGSKEQELRSKAEEAEIQKKVSDE